MTPAINVRPGDVYGRGVVLEEIRMPIRLRQARNGKTYGDRGVRMMCECGTEYTCRTAMVVNGNTGSCGCLRQEVAADSLSYWRSTPESANFNQAKAVIHGYSHHAHYGRWTQMMRRCHNAAAERYPDYGGRGITVTPEWRDPKTFCDWLDANLGACPSGHSMDRIDNDGNYEPSNVRWASAHTQRVNARAKAA